MTRSPRRTASIGRFTLALVGVVMATSGCVLASPTVTTTPYAASDGTNAQISNSTDNSVVKLRNFLVVGSAKGSPGVLFGAIAADSPGPVEVKVSISAGQGQSPLVEKSVTVRPGELLQVGPEGTVIEVPDLPQGPGTVLNIKASTAAGGTDFSLPVVAPSGQYASLTPSASPSPSA